MCFHTHHFLNNLTENKDIANWKKQYLEQAVSCETDITVSYMQIQGWGFFRWCSQIGFLLFKLSIIHFFKIQYHLTCQEKNMSQNASLGRCYAALKGWLFQYLQSMVLSLDYRRRLNLWDLWGFEHKFSPVKNEAISKF